ncbi:MAG: sugar phosphate nucleotidyltransferase [Anaerolineae bacterium]
MVRTRRDVGVSMQGVILTAGEGTRLLPLTRRRSKAMLPVLGKPLAERVLTDLYLKGVTDFVVVVSPEDDEIVQHFRRLPNVEVRFVYQAEPLGMADALRRAAPLIEGSFILAACDNLVSAAHVGRMLEAWHSVPRPSAVLTLTPVEQERLGSVGIVEMEGPWITRILEKPSPEEAPSNICSVPLYIFSPRILAYLSEIPLSPRGEYEIQDAIQMLIEREGYVGGVLTPHRWTVTRPADLLTVNRYFLRQEGSRIAPGDLGIGTQLITPLWIDPGVSIGAECVIGPEVYLEGGCRVGDGVTLRNAVVLRNATVNGGTTFVDSVIA